MRIRVNAISDKEAHLRVSTCFDEVHVFHDSKWNGYLVFIRGGDSVRFVEPLCKGGRYYVCKYGEEIELPQPDWVIRPDGLIIALPKRHAMRGFMTKEEALLNSSEKGFFNVGLTRHAAGDWEWFYPPNAPPKPGTTLFHTVEAMTPPPVTPSAPLAAVECVDAPFSAHVLDIVREYGYCEDSKQAFLDEFKDINSIAAWCRRHGFAFEARARTIVVTKL